jgi:hypothetical protein
MRFIRLFGLLTLFTVHGYPQTIHPAPPVDRPEVTGRGASTMNGIPQADQFPGADFCVKLRAAEVYALANHIGRVDASHFTGTQACSVDPLGRLAASNANIDLTVSFGATHVQSTVPWTITNPGLSVIAPGPFEFQLEYTGSSVIPAILTIGSSAPETVFVEGVRLSGMFLYGDKANAADALLAEGFHHSILSDILTWGVTGCGIHTEFAVTDTLIAPRSSNLDATQLGIANSSHSIPSHGLCLGQYAAGGYQTTNTTIMDAAAEGLRGPGAGWWLSSANNMVFTAGTSEGNAGEGLQIDNGSVSNTFIGIDLEGNGGVNALDNGNTTEFDNVIADAKAIELGPTSEYFVSRGGNLTAPITVDAGASLYDVSYGVVRRSLLVTQSIQSNAGLQLATGPGCTIEAGGIGNDCVATIALVAHEPDTNYKVLGCTVYNPTGGNTTSASQVRGLTTTSFQVVEVALSPAGTGGGTINCIVAHS